MCSQNVKWHENHFLFCHDPFPSRCRSLWWVQFLSYPLCSPALCLSHPLGISGVSVHPPHQRLAPASRDPRQASPPTETQSRAPAFRICKLVAHGMAVTPWPYYELQKAGITFSLSLLRKNFSFMYRCMGSVFWADSNTTSTFKMVSGSFFMAPRRRWCFYCAGDTIVNVELPHFWSYTTAWSSFHAFPQKSSGGCRGEKVNPTCVVFRVFYPLTALCELLLLILFSMPGALSKNKFLLK